MKESPIFGGGQLLTIIHQLKVIRLIFKMEALLQVKKANVLQLN